MIFRVNFFSLDVEGAEKLVLDTIDFSRVQIDILMIEVENSFCKTDCEVRKQVRKKMADAGYEKHEGIVQASDVYIHPNFVTGMLLLHGYIELVLGLL